MSRTLAATSRIPIVASLIVILIIGFSLAPATAAGAGNPGVIHVGTGTGVAHAASGSRVDLSGISSTRSASGYAAYVYADDGETTANTIDEYGATPTGLIHLGTVLTGGSETNLTTYAQNDIAISNNASHGACLIHADTSGLVESFSINLATGLLTKVSSVAPGAGNPHLGDVKLSPNGNDAYVVAPTGQGFFGSALVSLPIGAGCTLGTAMIFIANMKAYTGIAIPNATQLFAPNGYGSLDIYTIAGNGLTLSLQTSTRGELPAPQGAASGVVGATMYTFNGLVFPGEAAVEAHTLDTRSGVLGSVAGSPAGDPTSRGGTSANVLFIPGLNLVTQTEQVTNSVASYSVTGGHFQLVNHAALDSSASFPISQTTIAHYLLVENGGSGTISACHLASNGISGCFMAATLTSNGGQRQPGGIDVIPA